MLMILNILNPLLLEAADSDSYVTSKSPLFFIKRILSNETIGRLTMQLQRLFLQGCSQDERSPQTSTQQLTEAAANQVMSL